MIKIALIVTEIIRSPRHGGEIRYFQNQEILQQIVPGKVVFWDLTRNGSMYYNFDKNIKGIFKDFCLFPHYFWPFSLPHYLTARAVRDILSWIDREQPSHAVITHPLATVLVPELKRRGICVFVDCHNVERVIAWQVIKASPFWRHKLAYARHWFLTRRVEQRILPLADEIWMTSAADARLQARLCQKTLTIRCVPNALDIRKYTPRQQASLSHDMVFPGNFFYAPNIVSARLLAQKILPRVKTVIPDTRLILAGQDSHGIARSLHNGSDIIATGAVPDICPYLHQAGVVPVPLLHGSGTRLKIAESLACALPVVSTPIGCEGLNVEDGVHLAIRAVDEFAETIIMLLSQPEVGHRMGTNGRKLVEEEYSWDAVRKILTQALFPPVDAL